MMKKKADFATLDDVTFVGDDKRQTCDVSNIITNDDRDDVIDEAKNILNSWFKHNKVY